MTRRHKEVSQVPPSSFFRRGFLSSFDSGSQWGIVILLCSLPIVAWACTAQGRYRTLTFFFDGVPDPNAEPEAPQPSSAQPTTNEERIAALGYEVKAPEVTWHQPVKEKLCDSCHTVGGSGGVSPMGASMLIRPREQLCLTCHALDEEYRHGPAAAGECLLCHLPHQSTTPHLLRVEYERVREVCVTCHAEEQLLQVGKHDVEELQRSCTECHDPHQSSQPFLVRDGTGWKGIDK